MQNIEEYYHRNRVYCKECKETVLVKIGKLEGKLWCPKCNGQLKRNTNSY